MVFQKMEKQILIPIFLCILLPLILVIAHGQGIPGFISIDCGASKEYADEQTGIYYVTDLHYLDADRGESRSISSEFKTTKNPQQYWNLRSFPKGRKNCYKLKPPEGKNHTYLIRAGFMYGNYDSEKNSPEFDLYLGADKWSTVKVEDSENVITKEIIHVLQSDYTYVCLVKTGSDVPFISVLELRLLNKENRAYVTEAGSIELAERRDCGLSPGNIVRYKDDAWDRIWSPYNSDNLNVMTTSFSVNPFNTFAPPSLVMSTTVMPPNVDDSLEIEWTTGDNNRAEIYLCFHFSEIQNLTQNQTREMNIYVNDDLWFGPLEPKYLYAYVYYSKRSTTASSVHIRISKTERSTLPPTLSAFEIFTAKPMVQPLTDQDDVDAITEIKSAYGLGRQVEKDWEGDPCTPSEYTWGGLNCRVDGSDTPRIISLNLSSSGLTGEITPHIFDLKMLQTLDLSNNNLSGIVPDFLSHMPSLSALNLENNNFSGILPIGLQEQASRGSILLRANGNLHLCLTNSCTEKEHEEKNKNKDTNRVPILPIVASIIGVLVLASIVGLVIWWQCLKRKKRGQVDTTTTAVSVGSGMLDEELDFGRQRFSYSQIQSITNNFDNVIGKGGFGIVCLGIINNSRVAVKMITHSTAQGYMQFKTEAMFLTRIHHRNLTDLVGYCDEGSNMGLVYEYMSNGDLAWHLSDKNSHPLSWEERLKIALDSAQGLEYLHSGCRPPIIHRDVKTTNILLNEHLQAKLSDFGLSRAISMEGNSHVSTIVAGTPGYLDPEYYGSNRLTEKSDVFSFGVVLLEIITGRTAILKDKNGKIHIIEWVRSLISKGDINSIVDPRILDQDLDKNSVWKAVELGMACGYQSSNKRPNMTQVVVELKQCLAMEMARNSDMITGEVTESSEFFRGITSEVGPFPR